VEESLEITSLRQRFVDDLVREGALTEPEWEQAFRRVPRHHFVPRITGWWPPEESGETEALVDGARDRDRWLRLVYSDRLLVTVNDGRRESSSSRPRVMLQFLEGLRLEAGCSVLEIGAGTGYNAALLCERVGAHNVTTIDIDAELVDLARMRLAGCGYEPTLAVADGSHGYPERAPYDRIIATCSVPRIPDAWVDQLRVGGVMVAPMAGGHFERVGLVKLRKRADGSVSGIFNRGGTSFMPLRQHVEQREGMSADELASLVKGGVGVTRPGVVPEWLQGGPDVVNVTEHRAGLEPNFLLRLEVGEMRWFWLDQVEGRGKAPAVVSGDDGSWARVSVDQDGSIVVTQGGPRRLWDLVERSWDLFVRSGRPHMGRYGITITPERRQFVWLDSPESGCTWEL
jgi:protein-L-isoaspartate(D-aspartate) O-methyltransferase